MPQDDIKIKAKELLLFNPENTFLVCFKDNSASFSSISAKQCILQFEAHIRTDGSISNTPH
jgi:hypothetical protein